MTKKEKKKEKKVKETRGLTTVECRIWYLRVG